MCSGTTWTSTKTIGFFFLSSVCYRFFFPSQVVTFIYLKLYYRQTFYILLNFLPKGQLLMWLEINTWYITESRGKNPHSATVLIKVKNGIGKSETICKQMSIYSCICMIYMYTHNTYVYIYVIAQSWPPAAGSVFCGPNQSQMENVWKTVCLPWTCRDIFPKQHSTVIYITFTCAKFYE